MFACPLFDYQKGGADRPHVFLSESLKLYATFANKLHVTIISVMFQIRGIKLFATKTKFANLTRVSRDVVRYTTFLPAGLANKRSVPLLFVVEFCLRPSILREAFLAGIAWGLRLTVIT